MTRDQQAAAMRFLITTIGDAIQELGTVPAGHLYARVMEHMTLDTFNAVIQALKDARAITESHHVLTWVGPRKDTTGN